MPVDRFKLKALVIDGDRQVRRLLGRTLKQEGYLVRLADGPAAAVPWLARYRPDVTILDPWADSGPHGTELLKQVQEWNSNPILVLSEDGSDEAKIAAFEAGADAYVTKPFEERDLLAWLRMILRRRGLR